MSKRAATGWIGVDLDGTLAHYRGWRGHRHVGEPVPAMLARVKAWIAEGRNVKIFTARVSGDRAEAQEVREAIAQWLVRHGLPLLEITCIKDYAMLELWDDRCVTVEENTGRCLGRSRATGEDRVQ